MSHDDLVTITCSLYPDLDQQMIQKMVVFNNKVRKTIKIRQSHCLHDS